MQKKKTEIITARMTSADKKAIRQRAKAAGMTVTDYLREYFVTSNRRRFKR